MDDKWMKLMTNKKLLFWLKANKKNKNVKVFINELDKRAQDEYDIEHDGRKIHKDASKDYFEYLNDNIGDYSSWTYRNAEQIQCGILIVKYDEEGHFFKMSWTDSKVKVEVIPVS